MSLPKEIKHVIYYMLENRSFDNLLGWLYDAENQPKQIIANPAQKNDPFYGLEENKYYNCFDGDPTKHYITKGTETIEMPDPDPHEAFSHVTRQLFGKNNPAEGEVPDMSGFLADYYDQDGGVSFFGASTKEAALQMTRTYSPEQLSVINGLAKNYAVSDRWFASVPSQTNCNRAFSICGTSLGLVNNQSPGPVGLVPTKFNTRTIWDALSENGFASADDWMVYYQTADETLGEYLQFWKKDLCYTEDAFNIPDPENHVAPIAQFFQAAAKGELPAFSYLEPYWIGFTAGAQEDLETKLDLGDAAVYAPNSYHPPSEVIPGEHFLKKLYDAMNSTPAAREAWKQTVLVISFDENGGIYDHVPPPWGATPPWGKGNPPPAGVTLEGHFQFDRFGARVPMLLVSPWVEEQTVFRSLTDVPYDHTSTIATILEWKGIPKDKWGLGERTANAPTWDNVLTRTTPRDDFPEVEVAPALRQAPAPDDMSYSDLQATMLPRQLQKLSGNTLSPEDLQKETETILANSKTVGDLQKAVTSFAKKYQDGGGA